MLLLMMPVSDLQIKKRDLLPNRRLGLGGGLSWKLFRFVRAFAWFGCQVNFDSPKRVGRLPCRFALVYFPLSLCCEIEIGSECIRGEIEVHDQ